MITFSKISASYDGKNQAVSGVSFCVDKPAIVGIIGPNGAGKIYLHQSCTAADPF